MQVVCEDVFVRVRVLSLTQQQPHGAADRLSIVLAQIIYTSKGGRKMSEVTQGGSHPYLHRMFHLTVLHPNVQFELPQVHHGGHSVARQRGRNTH